MPYGTSEYQARIRVGATDVYDASERTVGTIASRTVMVNNINHYQDSFGQQRMSWSAVQTGKKDEWLESERTTFTQMVSSRPFPIAVREDGTSYRIRLSIGAAMASVGPKGRIVVVLSPTHLARSILDGVDYADFSDDSVWFSDAVNGTTPAYIGGSSLGPNAWDKMVWLTAEQASAYTRPVSAPVDLGGASSSRLQCMVSINVFGLTDTAGTSNAVRLYSACATEWPG